MKILLLTTHLNYGGISSYTFSLAKELTAMGHRVICASSGGDLRETLENSGIEHFHIPIRTKSELSPLLSWCFFKLRGLIRNEGIEIIHAQTRVTQVLGTHLSRSLRVPMVSTCHGFFRRNIGRQIFPAWGEKVIAISEQVKKHLLIDFYVPEQKVALIPNGIDVSSFRVSAARLDPHHPDRTVGVIARLSVVKGHVYLIEAMAKVIEEFPDARLFLFGDGKIKYKLVQLAEKLKIQDHILFLPSVSNPAEVLKEIDIFVMPSLQEGLGLSILEAQACGIPVVASGVGGILSVIKNNVNGILVPPKDTAALAGTILKIMDNKSLAMRLGKKAREDVEENFNLQTMAKNVEQIYRGVIKHEK